MAKPIIHHTNTTKIGVNFTRAEMDSLIANAVLHVAGRSDLPREAVSHVYFERREIGHSGVYEWVVEVTIDNTKLPTAVES